MYTMVAKTRGRLLEHILFYDFSAIRGGGSLDPMPRTLARPITNPQRAGKNAGKRRCIDPQANANGSSGNGNGSGSSNSNGGVSVALRTERRPVSAP